MLKTLLFVVNFSFDTLPPRSVCIESLRAFHARNVTARLAEYAATEQNAWMKWMPSIGIQSGLDLIPRPTISYSLNQVYNARNERAKVVSKRASVASVGELEFYTDSLKLEIELERLEILKSGLIMLEAEERIDDKSFELEKSKIRIIREKHSKKYEITDSDLMTAEQGFLTWERSYLERGNVRDVRRREISILRLEIRLLSRL
jgi:hypothetical protein